MGNIQLPPHSNTSAWPIQSRISTIPKSLINWQQPMEASQNATQEEITVDTATIPNTPPSVESPLSSMIVAITASQIKNKAPNISQETGATVYSLPSSAANKFRRSNKWEVPQNT
jgi:hypothetical protein